MTTQPTTSIEERVSRLEGSHERIGDVARTVEAHRAETQAGFDALRADTNMRFESGLAEIRAARADSDAKFQAMRQEANDRFESGLAEIRAMRVDSDAKFQAMRQEMNDRFRSLTNVLIAAAVVLSTVLVGLTGAIIGLYARVG